MSANRVFVHRFRLVMGCVLAVAGLFGAVHAVQAGIAQSLYVQTKYGIFRGTRFERPQVTDPEEASSRLYTASRLYADNYYFPAYVAQLWLSQGVPAAKTLSELKTVRKAADLYARQAIALNPYNDEARYAYAKALATDKRKAEAIAFWESFVFREYWDRERVSFYVGLLRETNAKTNLIKAAQHRYLVKDPVLRRRLEKQAKLFATPTP